MEAMAPDQRLDFLQIRFGAAGAFGADRIGWGARLTTFYTRSQVDFGSPRTLEGVAPQLLALRGSARPLVQNR
jgi:hypothetical protein